MFCKKCGKELQDNWNSCPYCGEAVNIDDQKQQSFYFEKKSGSREKILIIISVIVLLVMAGIIAIMVGKSVLKSKSVRQPVKVSRSVPKDFSSQDFESIIKAAPSELEKLGLVKEDGKDEYTGLDGAVRVVYKDDKIQNILIEGEEKTAPLFHGVKLGMSMKEVETSLLEAYPEKEENESALKFIDMTGKKYVECSFENDRLKKIYYSVLSEEEAASYQKKKEEKLRAEYIFPDSDKKYLSEDEVRAKSVEEMKIGRNEIFARHGYIFNDENLGSHFNSTSWYKGTVTGDEFDAEGTFNEFEKKNVELIKRIEDEINGVNTPFVGKMGVYCTTDSSAGGWTGWIEILSVQNDTLTFDLGMLTPSKYIIMTETAQITGSNTAQYSEYGFTITFTWADESNMFVTHSGDVQGTDSGVIMDVTNRRGYVWSGEFNRN